MNSDVLQEEKQKPRIRACTRCKREQQSPPSIRIFSIDSTSSSLTVSFGLFVLYYRVLHHRRLCSRCSSPYTAPFPPPSPVLPDELHARDTSRFRHSRFLSHRREYTARANQSSSTRTRVTVDYSLASNDDVSLHACYFRCERRTLSVDCFRSLFFCSLLLLSLSLSIYLSLSPRSFIPRCRCTRVLSSSFDRARSSNCCRC